MTDTEPTTTTTTSLAHLAEAARETATKDGLEFVNDSVWIAEIVDGRTTVMRTLSLDPEPARRFWASIDTGVPA